MCCDNNNCKKEYDTTKVNEILQKHKGNASGLITCLQEIQAELSFVPKELVPTICKELGVPESDIYSVLTFYTQFNLKPKAKYKIEVCLGTACFVLGSSDVLTYLKQKLGISLGEVSSDGKFELAQSRCFGCCSLAPAIAINGEIFGKVTQKDIDQLLEKCN